MTDMTIMADMIVVIDMIVENVMTDMTEIGIMMITMMVVDTEVVAEEDITENADHLLTTKIDHAMIGLVRVLILHVVIKSK